MRVLLAVFASILALGGYLLFRPEVNLDKKSPTKSDLSSKENELAKDFCLPGLQSSYRISQDSLSSIHWLKEDVTRQKKLSFSLELIETCLEAESKSWWVHWSLDQVSFNESSELDMNAQLSKILGSQLGDGVFARRDRYAVYELSSEKNLGLAASTLLKRLALDLLVCLPDSSVCEQAWKSQKWQSKKPELSTWQASFRQSLGQGSLEQIWSSKARNSKNSHLAPAFDVDSQWLDEQRSQWVEVSSILNQSLSLLRQSSLSQEKIAELRERRRLTREASESETIQARRSIEELWDKTLDAELYSQLKAPMDEADLDKIMELLSDPELDETKKRFWLRALVHNKAHVAQLAALDFVETIGFEKNTLSYVAGGMVLSKSPPAELAPRLMDWYENAPIEASSRSDLLLALGALTGRQENLNSEKIHSFLKEKKPETDGADLVAWIEAIGNTGSGQYFPILIDYIESSSSSLAVKQAAVFSLRFQKEAAPKLLGYLGREELSSSASRAYRYLSLSDGELRQVFDFLQSVPAAASRLPLVASLLQNLSVRKISSSVWQTYYDWEVDPQIRQLIDKGVFSASR